ncbi:methionyl aminopeptidase 1 (M24 family) [Schistosoma mansoni]|uniref:methionyl aminopeptidase 1 (M24 family) n=1 Tax=Schistosoma mansoni TaxID=6183 RepID=UPI0001A63322|nr:methionyl aminopeptidase 1 (M24 family) [Schistosoma mansoni]|eukprot:XP_018653127.1 methionyl aminopeptidase 1 (M24 family) [Schistosoma mansoni]
MPETAKEDTCEDERFRGYKFTGQLRPAKKTPKREVKSSIEYPDYAITGIPVSERQAKGSRSIVVLDDDEIECMRVTGKLAREVLEEAVNAVKVGVTTDEIDRVAHEACIERECYPSPLNYFNFPKSCCTSVNEVICHGIPDMRPLQNGDILNIDITTYHNGFHGDVNETVFVGQPDDRSVNLVKNAYKCLVRSMDAVFPGVKYREMGDIISKNASLGGFSVVKTYSGHGIHRLFHCPPNILHYSRNKAVGVMKPGHCFTIEPMINQGDWRDELWPDNWTAVTADGLRSAQFEHTMVILKPELAASNGMPIEVLTKRHIKGSDPLNGCKFNKEDTLHFERYGRPYFVDQLYKLGLNTDCRAAWIGLNTASYICELVFLGLAIAAQISPDWAVYDVTYIGLIDDYNQLSRSRGLWKQCITNEIVSTSYNGQCYPLENCEEFSSYNDKVLPIFLMRHTINILQIAAIILVFINIIITCTILLTACMTPEKIRYRTAQYAALGGGAALWFTGKLISCILRRHIT